MTNSLLKPVLIGSTVGVFIGCLLIYVAASAAFGDSESTTIAQNVFPYALAFDATLLDNRWIVLGLALTQFPLYGVVLAVTWPRTRRRAIVFITCIAMLGGAHLVAMREAHIAYAAWQETFVKWE
jgi:hypothetical protein